MNATTYIDGTVETTYHESAEAALAKANLDLMRSDVVSTYQRKVGRNHPCPCGSGRKFKKCCIRKMQRGV